MTFQIKAILMCHKTVKNTNFLSSHGFFSSSKIHEKPVFGRGSALDPAGRAYDASPDLLLVGAPVRSPCTPLASRSRRIRCTPDLDPHYVNGLNPGSAPVNAVSQSELEALLVLTT